MTLLDFLTQTATLASVIESGQTLAPEETDTILMLLNNLLDGWNTERLNIFTISAGTYALAFGTQVYPIGPAAPAPYNVARPVMIESANVIGTGLTSNDIEVVSAVEWAAITDKNMTAKLPLKLYCDYAYPKSTISVWPIPSANCQLELFSWGSPAPFIFPQDPGTFPPNDPGVQQYLTKAIALAANAVLLPSAALNLIAGQGTYEIGPGAADFNTTRPLLIQSANILLTTTLRYPLQLISSRDWASIQERAAQSGRPLKLYYDNAYPTPNLNLWPVPTAAATTLELFTWSALSQYTTADLGTDLAYPPGYLEPLQYGLAVALPSAFGLQLADWIAQKALDSKARLRQLNAEVSAGMTPAPPTSIPVPTTAA